MIQFDIYSEDSEIHWQNFNVENEIVLDLGCGRAIRHMYEYQQSPIFLGEILKANKVIGIDGNPEIGPNIPETGKTEIQLLTEWAESKKLNNKYTFIFSMITQPSQIKDILKQYEITAIKCDIEGYETNFYPITKEDLSAVKSFALEYHSNEIRENFINKFSEWGFNIYAEGKFTYCDATGAGVLIAKK